MNDDSYDVVADALQKYKHMLWKMTEQNINADMFNVMDQIRLDQIKELDKAINERKQPKREWIGLTDDDEIPWDGVDAKSFAKAIEAKLKQKNGFTEEKNT